MNVKYLAACAHGEHRHHNFPTAFLNSFLMTHRSIFQASCSIKPQDHVR